MTSQGKSPGIIEVGKALRTDHEARFGASLSYASRDGSFGVETPQVLDNSMLKDDEEIVILSDRSCNDGKCGYTRPGGLAYRKSPQPLISSINLILCRRVGWRP